ncbi:hypothetical protein HZR23_07290 [Serpentinicella alkaliphila]|uniref:hypothetical protein n=1 Tax=Serpentinicella alkaliphila TaxID=1734049 RepID=UPI001BC86A44|nr:hypothetical protein [Serpentinicella alkaliphila]QUH25561.1 hypothetical protein HZR23_07290 [Serpentinicella alkaliphila]
MFENREEKGDSPAMTSLEYATDSCGWNITKDTSANLFEEMIKEINIMPQLALLLPLMKVKLQPKYSPLCSNRASTINPLNYLITTENTVY